SRRSPGRCRTDPHRPWHAVWGIPPALLAASMLYRGPAGCPAAYHALGRGTRRLSRWPGHRGAARIALSPPRHFFGVWAALRSRDPVLLSRLAVRRRRDHSRDPRRTRDQYPEGSPLPWGVSYSRV